MGYALFAYRLGFSVCGRQERAAPRGWGKRVDTKVSTLLTPTSFWESTAKFAELRLAKERQSGYRSVDFVKYSQFTDSVLLHRRLSLRRARHKVNCPKGKRGSPGGYPCRAIR